MVRKPEPGEQRDQDDDAGGLDEEAESRNAILRRRALFVASAVAGLSLPSACADAPPNVCLSPPVPRTAQESAGTSASSASSTSAAPSGSAAPSPFAQPSALPSASAPPSPSADPTVVAPPTKTGTPPRACLRMASPPPTVCLMMAIPSDDKSKP
jgi:hypothetical protein